MKSIRLHFCDFWPSFRPDDNLFYQLISKHFEVNLSTENPDYVICSVFGDAPLVRDRRRYAEHYKYENAIKIMYTGENILPDLNYCDYGIGFDDLTLGDRYFRFPLYAYYDSYAKLRMPRKNLTAKDIHDRSGFCNFTFSNNSAAPQRDQFFAKLNARKPVCSTGRHLRNSTALDDLQQSRNLPPPDAKVALLEQFKFNIAFENTSHPGYTTEKLMEPLAARCLPIYFGNPDVAVDFDPASFINVHEFIDLDAAVDEVMRLDTDDAAYLEKINANPIPASNQATDRHRDGLESFLCRIIERPAHTARRRTMNGMLGNAHRRLGKRSANHKNRWWLF